MFKKIDHVTLKKMYNDLYHCNNNTILRKDVEKELIRLNLSGEVITYYENLSVDYKINGFREKFKKNFGEKLKTEIKMHFYRELYKVMKTVDFERHSFEKLLINFCRPKSRKEYEQIKIYEKAFYGYLEFFMTPESFLQYNVYSLTRTVTYKIKYHKEKYEKETCLLLMTKILPTDLARLLKNYI